MGPLGHSVAALSAAVGLPAYACALALRPSWRPGWRQRLGAIQASTAGGVWVHAASIGETRAALPLLRALLDRGDRVVLTHTRAAALEISTAELSDPLLPAPARAGHPARPGHLADPIDPVARSLAPLDHPWAVARALDRVAPRTIVLIETELWPNAIRQAADRGVALGVASASISERSFGRYRRVRAIVRPWFERLAFVAARSDSDAERFLALGVRPARVRTTGDLKLDACDEPEPLPRAIAASLGAAPLFVAGSTHEGEERAVLRALRACERRNVAARLAIAPRRTARCEDVARQIERAGFRVRRRTSWGVAPLGADEVALIDVTGELRSWYAAATLAFVGGTLADVGGHNPYEPLLQGALVVHGPSVHSVAQAVAAIRDCGAAEPVANDEELAEVALRWLEKPAEARARAARAAESLATGGDCAARTLAWIDACAARRAAG